MEVDLLTRACRRYSRLFLKSINWLLICKYSNFSTIVMNTSIRCSLKWMHFVLCPTPAAPLSSAQRARRARIGWQTQPDLFPCEPTSNTHRLAINARAKPADSRLKLRVETLFKNSKLFDHDFAALGLRLTKKPHRETPGELHGRLLIARQLGQPHLTN